MDKASASYLYGTKRAGFNPLWMQKKILMTSHSTTHQKQVAVAAAAKRREIVEMRCDMLEHRHREDKQHHFWERGTKMNLVQQNFTDSIVL